MATLLRFSEAAALGIHAMVYLAADGGSVASARVLARANQASEAHMVKICQRLARQGLLTARRGPGGGFSLGRAAQEIRLLDVFTAIEGPLAVHHCLFQDGRCRDPKHGDCIFGPKIRRIEEDFMKYLARTTLATMARRCHTGRAS